MAEPPARRSSREDEAAEIDKLVESIRLTADRARIEADIEKEREETKRRTLEVQDKANERQFTLFQGGQQQNYVLRIILIIAGTILTIAFLGFALYTFTKGSTEIAETIITVLISAVLGFLGGFGVGRTTKPRS